MRVYSFVNTQSAQFQCSLLLLKMFVIPFRTMFQCFNVASIGPEISFRSFDVSHRRRWGGDYHYFTPSSYSFLVSLFPPKTMIYII